MEPPALLLWLLVSRLGARTCGQGVAASRPRSAPFLNNSLFAGALYRHLQARTPGHNVLFSPLGAALPLTLLGLLAAPEPRAQLLRGLGWVRVGAPMGDADLATYSRPLHALLAPGCGPQTRTRTRSALFVDQRRFLRPHFVQVAASLFLMDVVPVSLSGYDAARGQVGAYLSERPYGGLGLSVRMLIRAVSPDWAFHLANYAAFAGKWQFLFNSSHTESHPFWLTEESMVMVPTMQRLGDFQIKRDQHLHSHILRLPFSCGAFAIFILPDSGHFKEAELAVMADPLSMSTQSLPRSRYRLFLPKFSLNGTAQMDQLLPAVGISEIFRHRMGIRGISVQTSPMRLFKVAHGAGLAIEEDGVQVEDLSYLENQAGLSFPLIHFNRPFLVMVLEETNTNVLFLGKLMNPLVGTASWEQST
ncbi:hibernation-specific plasma protein HP-55-like [Erinaceus europaeus]|uniref:Hibernation-specific plasma protein HP-55-like n=1 Tax=Erinaceus europaeus TaxID=9365 RepID=A0A1S3A4G6_ERIEU|nr:hibernation-specific plasma protein HP-55-like [Erinaceus europaeus]XP_060036953.1 hibernation-specific plasma protein HP-55-like [Erinaceus europaeus]